MSTYLCEFIEAAERTKRLKLKFDSFVLDTEKVFIHPALYNSLKTLLYSKYPEFVFGGLALRCANVSYSMKSLVDYYIGCETIITCGYITVTGEDRFFIDETEAKKMLQNGKTDNIIRFHVWLTLPSTEIIDFTIGNSFARTNPRFPKNEYVLRHPDCLNESLEYHPVIIGEDFLRQTGFLIDII